MAAGHGTAGAARRRRRRGAHPPDLCPRIRARSQPTDLPEDDRPTGVGSTRQIQADLTTLAEFGAGYVVLDTNPYDPSGRRPPEHDWGTLRSIADQARAALGR